MASAPPARHAPGHMVGAGPQAGLPSGAAPGNFARDQADKSCDTAKQCGDARLRGSQDGRLTGQVLSSVRASQTGIQMESCASCVGIGGPTAGERQHDSPASVGPRRWLQSGRGVDGIVVGSVQLQLPAGRGLPLMHADDGTASAHMLAPSQDKPASFKSAEDDSESLGDTWDSSSTEEDLVGPPMASLREDVVDPRNDLFLVSLSTGLGEDTCPVPDGELPCTPCTREHSPVEALCEEIRKAITPVLAMLPNQEGNGNKRRQRQKRAPVSSPRRSVRLAKGLGRGGNATKQQNVLIRKLCLANEGETISDAALQAYVQLFDKPLSDEHISAILALFGWEPSALPLTAQEDRVVEGL